MITITRGIKPAPVRAVVYGPEGVGKTTLAAQFPAPLFLDIEDGTGQIDVARVKIASWDALVATIKTLATDPHGAKTIVIDSADWAERALIEHVLNHSGKASIEDFGYGKGYTVLAEHWARFLALCDTLIAAGLHVVFTAHSAVRRQSPPDQTDGFDRYELKLSKQVAPQLKEWSDLLLFCAHKVHVVEGSDGKIKAQGGKERVMHATHSAAWDAKNRYGLPDEMPLAFAALDKVFGAATPAATPSPQPQPPAPSTAPRKLATAEQVAELQALAKTGIGGAIIEQALAKVAAVDVGEFTSSQAAKLLAYIAERTAAATQPVAPVATQPVATPALPTTPSPSPAAPATATPLEAWLEANEAGVNGYLRRVGWIGADESWRELSPERRDKIDLRRDQFARAAGLQGGAT